MSDTLTIAAQILSGMLANPHFDEDKIEDAIDNSIEVARKLRNKLEPDYPYQDYD